jgi:MscS family membrane protein
MLHLISDMNFSSSLHWLDFEIGENTIAEYLIFTLVLIGQLFLRRFISVLVSRLIYKIIRKKPQFSAVRTFESLLAKPLEWLITLLVLYFSISQLDIPSAWHLDSVEKPGLLRLLSKLFELTLVGAFTFLILRLLDFFAIEFIEGDDKGKQYLLDKQIMPFVKELLKIFIVIVAFFFGLGFVFELNVGNIIAGLGLGGLAFALAAKESLENLFASFTIFLDKPFVVGDQVTVNNITGTIEKVGFRSTRIRTLEKSFLTLPNKLMIDNALDNHTLRTHRRADFILTLEYGTGKDELEIFLSRLQSMLEQNPRTSEESLVRFFAFGESGFNIRLLYFVDTNDYNEFQKIREEINFEILTIVAELGIRLAYPTQKIQVQSS